MYKLSSYVPVPYWEVVKQALFDKGTGKIGDYDCCCWQVLGEGQFRPLEGSQPFIGQQGKIEKVAEYKVEMVCADEFINGAVEALLTAHPYQQPAYEIYLIENI